MIAEEIIIKPIISEKSNKLQAEGKYTFKVNKKATKIDIANAVEKLFNVKVLKVNTINYEGKTKRARYKETKRSDWKKAIVTIQTEDKDVTYLAKGGKVQKSSKKFNESIDEISEV